jgi:hypothetical protein
MTTFTAAESKARFRNEQGEQPSFPVKDVRSGPGEQQPEAFRFSLREDCFRVMPNEVKHRLCASSELSEVSSNADSSSLRFSE